MVCRIAEAICRWGYWARLALADTPRAAYGLARFHQPHAERCSLDTLRCGSLHARSLARRRLLRADVEVLWVTARSGHTLQAVRHLPPEALSLPASVTGQLHTLGLHTIGSLSCLPRYALQERFGPELLQRLDQLLGLREDPLAPPDEPPAVCALWHFESPTDDPSLVGYVLDRLLERLLRDVSRRHQAVAQLVLTIYVENTSPCTLPLQLFHPSCTYEHLRNLLHLQLDRTNLPGRVESLRLEATELVAQRPKQPALFADACPETHSDRWAVLVERLVHRLGEDRVFRVREAPDAQPEYAVELFAVRSPLSFRRRTQPPTCADNVLRARPLRLVQTPEAVLVRLSAMHGVPAKFYAHGRQWTVRRCSEPERIETGWWRHRRTVRRDYYQVETLEGAVLWLYRDLNTGRWYLHGAFD